MLSDQHIEDILKAFTERKDVEKNAHRAAVEEIRENEFNLNIPRYVDTFEEEEEIDIAAVQAEIEKLEGELAGVREEMGKHLEELGFTQEAQALISRA